MPLLPDLDALDRLRRRREWTWEQLARAMRRAHAPVPYRTLHHLLTHDGVKPHDRTLGRVQRFLRSSIARRDPRRKTSTSSRPEATV